MSFINFPNDWCIYITYICVWWAQAENWSSCWREILQFRDSTDLQKLMCPTCTYTNYTELHIFCIKSYLETYQSLKYAYTGSKSPLLPYPHCNVKGASHHVDPMARQREIVHPCICSSGGKVFEYSCAYSIPFKMLNLGDMPQHPLCQGMTLLLK